MEDYFEVVDYSRWSVNRELVIKLNIDSRKIEYQGSTAESATVTSIKVDYTYNPTQIGESKLFYYESEDVFLSNTTLKNAKKIIITVA